LMRSVSQQGFQVLLQKRDLKRLAGGRGVARGRGECFCPSCGWAKLSSGKLQAYRNGMH
jgi:hypothetical protein